MSNSNYSQKVKIAGYFFIVLIALSMLELTSFVITRANINALSKHLLMMPKQSAEDFDGYLNQRDDVLGWPSSNWKNDKTASDGSRVSPANTALESEETCISLYGDSFTYADDVNHEQAWGNLLAKKLGCQVKNFGVNGFGTGQAVLRFEKNVNDTASTIILGLFPDDLNRIQNQWRHLLTGKSPFGFKPSFSIDKNGQLKIHGIPVNNYEDYTRVLEAPDSILADEYYLPGQPLFLSRIKPGFPYILTMAKLGIRLIKSLDFTKLSSFNNIRHLNYPGWYDTKNGPSSKKIQIFTALVKRFSMNTKKLNKKGLLLLIPDAEMVLDVQQGKAHTLFHDLKPAAKIIRILDATPYLAEKSLSKGVCYYYGKSRDCTGHFNEDGNKLLAEYIHEQVEMRNTIAN